MCDMDEFANDKRTILEIASHITSADRNHAYGDALQDFTRVGKIWGAILDTDGPVPPDKVALMMIGLKVSRESFKPKRDTRVDIAGFAQCLDRVRSVLDSEQLDKATDQLVEAMQATMTKPLSLPKADPKMSTEKWLAKAVPAGVTRSVQQFLNRGKPAPGETHAAMTNKKENACKFDFTPDGMLLIMEALDTMTTRPTDANFIRPGQEIPTVNIEVKDPAKYDWRGHGDVAKAILHDVAVPDVRTRTDAEEQQRHPGTNAIDPIDQLTKIAQKATPLGARPGEPVMPSSYWAWTDWSNPRRHMVGDVVISDKG